MWALYLLATTLLAGTVLPAQSTNRVAEPVDTTRVVPLPNHIPAWAHASNVGDLVAPVLMLNQVTIVLSRAQDQEAAFEKLLADQQDPSSPIYHHWLTPAEVGERFGPSNQDTDAVIGWLQSQGLQVSFVSPSRLFINFNGAAANVGRAFHTELHYYNVNGEQRISIASDPLVPAALEPVIKGVRGLSTRDDHPIQHSARAEYSPYVTFGGNHYVSPSDFNKIYDVPTSYSGAGVTIGIVSGSRTNFADFANFR
jgi:subtilase family serine protease